MSWRSRDRSRQSSRWNSRDWDNWRRSQDWTPQPHRGDKKSRREALFQEELDQEIKQVRELAQTEHKQDREDTKAMVADKKKNAIRLQSALKLRSSLGEDQSSFALALDEDISKLRQAARSQLTPAKAVEDATVALAEARVRLTRATRHLQTAIESREAAELEVQRRTEELQSA